jgi:hypothetical protein
MPGDQLAEAARSLDTAELINLRRRERVLRDELRAALAEVDRLRAEVAVLLVELDRGPR